MGDVGVPETIRAAGGVRADLVGISTLTSTAPRAFSYFDLLSVNNQLLSLLGANADNRNKAVLLINLVENAKRINSQLPGR